MIGHKIVLLVSSLVCFGIWGARDDDDAGKMAMMAEQVLGSERVQGMQSRERQIQWLMDTLFAKYGAKANVDIALEVARLFPDGQHDAVIAKRAMFYSPLGAAELLKALSKDDNDAVMRAVLGYLPSRNLYTARLQSKQEFSVLAENYSLPAVETRRRGGGGPFYVMQGY